MSKKKPEPTDDDTPVPVDQLEDDGGPPVDVESPDHAGIAEPLEGSAGPGPLHGT